MRVKASGLIKYQPIWVLFVPILLVSLTACNRTVKGGYQVSPDGNYTLYIKSYGAIGKSYIDTTPKSVRVSFVANDNNETLLFQREYEVIGADVCEEGVWDTNGNLTIDIWDYGNGIDFYTARQRGYEKHPIRKISYRRDTKTGIFQELPTKGK
jgi:hypothetical protein